MRRLKSCLIKGTAYTGKAAKGLFILLAGVFILSGCNMRPLEEYLGEAFPPSVNEASSALEAVGGSGEGAGETRTLTLQTMLGEEAPDDSPSRVDYTDAMAWEYCYQCLDEPRRQWYRDIQRIIAGLEQEQALSAESLEAGLTEEDIDHIFCCVLADHPEYFYVDGYRYTKYSRMDKLVKIDFSGSYIYDEQECAVRWSQIQEKAEELLRQAPSEGDDYERVRYIYETLIRNTDYVLDAPDSQNLYSVLVSGESVCQGYAKATQYLLNHLGIPCVLVQGQVEPGEGHAWNLLCLDGEYYYMDTTWGDASYRREDTEAGEEDWIPQVNYDYLCVTTSQLLRTHTLSQDVPMPECTATRDNYYVREGCLLSSCDETVLQQAFNRAILTGRQEISFKCTDEEVYLQLLEHLIEQKEVFSYLGQDYRALHYARNEKQLSITFWFS
ncbi:MAG: hypothetical protein NC543_00230 [bacterium]|nr:hypothetical protein [bacterium]MCM1376001.1 hypothetical protein [Muribaculum sp.]